MKIVKIAFGTLFGLLTLCYIAMFLQVAIQFVYVWATREYSPQGLSQVGGVLVAMCIGVALTKWTFESAFQKPTSEQSESDEEPESSEHKPPEASDSV